MICKHKINEVKWFQVLSCIINNSIKHRSFVYTLLYYQTGPFQTIQFSICHLFAQFEYSNSSIWPIDRTSSGASIPDQSGPGSDGNKWVVHFPQSSGISGASPSDYFVLYTGHSFGGGVLLFCRDAVSVFYSPSRLSNQWELNSL